jgi:L-amino acid N-acyltransferase YncA
VRLLIDTNVLFPLEPQGSAEITADSTQALALARLAEESHSQILVHPAVQADLARDHVEDRRRYHEHVLARYPYLPSPPSITQLDVAAVGTPDDGTNDWVDNHLLAAVFHDAVDYLITQDQGIHRKAARLGLADRVLTVPDALVLLQALFGACPQPPPAVQAVQLHTIDHQQPFFDSFRADYPDFNDWVQRAKRSGRPAWMIAADGQLAGLCIVKSESETPYYLSGRVLKICSFKVAEEHHGSRYGELLLKTVFQYAEQNKFDHAYVTLFEQHELLVRLLGEFGFAAQPERTKRGELVLSRVLRPPAIAALEPLAYFTAFGPCHLRWQGATAWVVPIQPQYEALLFPDRQEQTSLFDGRQPFGNGIKKAYLCRSAAGGIHPGDVLAFYRSETPRAIVSLGVVENAFRSKDAESLGRFVAGRTVYSMDEIHAMCRGTRSVLALRFRQVLTTFPPIPLRDLLDARALKGAPQSITKLATEAAEWLRAKTET